MRIFACVPREGRQLSKTVMHGLLPSDLRSVVMYNFSSRRFRRTATVADYSRQCGQGFTVILLISNYMYDIPSFITIKHNAYTTYMSDVS